MKRLSVLLLVLLLCFSSGCKAPAKEASEDNFDLVAATYPVYVFVSRVIGDCEGVELKLLVDQNISCLHDYTLSVTDMKKIDSADALIISGAGLEVFLSDVTASYKDLTIIDASAGIELLDASCSDDEHSEHNHEKDSHIWLDPDNAAVQTANICSSLSGLLPQYSDEFEANAKEYISRLEALGEELKGELSEISTNKIITFHDGFAYFAKSLGLEVLKAIEEESGSEASAADIAEICDLIREYELGAVFTEVSGSDSTAKAIAAETGVKVYSLDMIMSGPHDVGDTDGYIEAMRKNVAVIKEALAS